MLHTHHFLAGLLAIHEALGDDVGSEQFITLPELLEEDPVGESLATDPDSFQHTITTQLIQNKVGIDLASLET